MGMAPELAPRAFHPFIDSVRKMLFVADKGATSLSPLPETLVGKAEFPASIAVDDDGFIEALAVADSGELEILAENRSEERLEIFERYAALGLKELERRIQQDSRDALDVILDILDEFGSVEVESERVDRLEGLL